MEKQVVKIDYKILRLKDLKETPGNPQKMTDEQFRGLISSMKKDGWILDAPVIWHRPDGSHQIISGHHRVRAGIEAGILETGCKVIDGISEEKVLLKVIEANQRRGDFDDKDLNKFIDNIIKDYNASINDIYLETGIDIDDILDKKQTEQYTRKITPPIYEPRSEKPDIKELYDKKKYKALINRIKESKIEDEIKRFLIDAASRHIQFNYNKIADYYAHSEKEIQELFEESALVIIDFEKAIENGYVHLTDQIIKQYTEEYEE